MSDTLDSTQINDLLDEALEAKNRAYAPYSNFRVGAALLVNDTVIRGCNIENVSFTPTVCAERVAIFSAISQGLRNFKAIAIISDNPSITAPCGVCRQVIAEFVHDDFQIILANKNRETKELSIEDLLPYRFVPEVAIGHKKENKKFNNAH